MARRAIVTFIAYADDQETVRFAARELAGYLRKFDPTDEYLPVPDAHGRRKEGPCIRVGLFETLTIDPGLVVSDATFDDAVWVSVSAGDGIIGGANPRSVLQGVYAFLYELGCRWVRPGAQGEYVPRGSLAEMKVHLAVKPAYRHRGICIEGAVGVRNVVDIIDWAPKVGFNAYFVQFREAYIFFERWYTHRRNPKKAPEPFSVDTARGLVDAIVTEVKKRGLLYHAVGHGWTCECLGIRGLGWDPADYSISEGVRRHLALVNGRRDVWNGVPLNTNLCYSNPETRRMCVEEIARYLETHREIDVLHFWLADESNNHCECAECSRWRPADLYVKMLNELDRLLTARGITAKVCFLAYLDLLWPPVSETILNEDRFILMFAPITRSFSAPLPAPIPHAELPPYTRNRLQFPKSVRENLAFVSGWRSRFHGGGFVFDYYLWRDHYHDPGYIQISRVINDDIRGLKTNGFDGLVSCQTQRAFLPTGFPMYLMGRTLWNGDLDFDAEASDYFAAAFGVHGDDCFRYLSQLTALFDPPYLRKETHVPAEEVAARMRSVSEHVRKFLPVVQANMNLANECHAASWRFLFLHSQICVRLAEVVRSRALGSDAESSSAWRDLEEFLQENEDQFQSVLDLYEMLDTLESAPR